MAPRSSAAGGGKGKKTTARKSPRKQPNPSPVASSSAASTAPTRVPKPLPNARDGRRTNAPPRYRPAPKYVAEIRKLQTTQNLLMPMLSFSRLVREITLDVCGGHELRFQGQAIRALQEAAEAYMVGFFEDSYIVTLHCKRVTLMAKDMKLAYRIRGDHIAYS